MNTSRNLRNYKSPKTQITIATCVLHQRLRNLLGSGDARIGNEVSVYGMGIVKVQYAAREVGTIARQQERDQVATTALVAALIEGADEIIVLLFAGLNL